VFSRVVASLGFAIFLLFCDGFVLIYCGVWELEVLQHFLDASFDLDFDQFLFNECVDFLFPFLGELLFVGRQCYGDFGI